MDSRAQQIQQGMKDAMGDLDVIVKVPWDKGKEIRVAYTKLKTRQAHTILYNCLLPGLKVWKSAFEADDAGIVEAISGIPKAVSDEKFWDAAEVILKEVAVDGRIYDGPDAFDDIFLMYLLVFHGVKANIPFSKLMPALSQQKSESTTSESGSDKSKS